MLMALIDGYPETAEWFLLVAAILFGVSGLLLGAARRTETAPSAAARRPLVGDYELALIPFGLALVALALLIL
jgi:hypothetical protein